MYVGKYHLVIAWKIKLQKMKDTPTHFIWQEYGNLFYTMMQLLQ